MYFLKAIGVENGIQTAWWIGFKSISTQLWSGHVRRVKRVFSSLGQQRRGRRTAFGRYMSRGAGQSFRHRRYLLARTIRRDLRKGFRGSQARGADLYKGNFSDGRWSKRSRIVQRPPDSRL